MFSPSYESSLSPTCNSYQRRLAVHIYKLVINNVLDKINQLRYRPVVTQSVAGN